MIIDNQLFGVLDIDSTSLDRFDEADEKLLGKLTDIIIKHLKRLKK